MIFIVSSVKVHHSMTSTQSKKVYREADGAVHYDQVIDECKKRQSDSTAYWSDDMKKDFVNAPHWSIEKWKSSMAGGGGNKKRFQYCTDPSGEEILYLRALQGRSGRNPIDPTLQDSVMILDDFFKYIYHVGCAINLHSIINSRLIPGRTNFEQQTDSILPACGSHG